MMVPEGHRRRNEALFKNLDLLYTYTTMAKRESSKKATATILEELKEAVAGKEEVLIMTHTHPDPDAIASAAALQFLLREFYKVKSSIAYSGIIARAENRAMVKRLEIHLKQYNRIKPSRYDGLILVDSQPGAGNNVLSAKSECDLVIDHHPRREDTNAKLVVIDQNIGATATLLVQWLDHAGLGLPVNLATALAYAIDSETQTMQREATQKDIQAYLKVYVRASLRKYGEIVNAHLPHYYFLQLGRALNNAQIYRNLITSHLTTILHPEIVAEMADFLLKHDRIGTVLCSGLYKDSLVISIRTSNEKLNAGELIAKLPLDRNNVGGHDKSAGGFVSLPKNGDGADELVVKLVASFAECMGYDEPSWRPLLEEGG